MPKTHKPPRTRTAPTPRASRNNANHCPSPHAAAIIAVPLAVPTWLRNDWSETAFAIPSFPPTACPGLQLEWAAKNATVAIHDAFAAYGPGSWDHIVDKPLAVYFAVCDVVLQRYVFLFD